MHAVKRQEEKLIEHYKKRNSSSASPFSTPAATSKNAVSPSGVMTVAVGLVHRTVIAWTSGLVSRTGKGS